MDDTTKEALSTLRSIITLPDQRDLGFPVDVVEKALEATEKERDEALARVAELEKLDRAHVANYLNLRKVLLERLEKAERERDEARADAVAAAEEWDRERYAILANADAALAERLRTAETEWRKTADKLATAGQERDEALAKVAELSKEAGGLERSMVAEFHRAMDVPVLEHPADPGVEVRRRRARLVLEEAAELVRELGFITYSGRHGSGELPDLRLVETGIPVSLAAVAKEAADLRYVVLGTELELGLPGEEVFRDVHASNMTKLGPGGKPVRREDGKVMKGPNYRPPDVEAIIRKYTAGEGQQKEST